MIDGKSVVVKIDAPKTKDPAVIKQATARFTREIEVTEQAEEGVPKILAQGVLPTGKKYFIMERIHGHTYKDIMRPADAEPLPPKFAADSLALIARLLTKFHKKGISHRDIKPENVMIDHEGKVYLIDFGLGKAAEGMSVSDLTTTGQMIGTPDYMSPEQFTNASVATTDSDNYSLGAFAYQAYDGHVPFPADNFAAMMALRAKGPPDLKNPDKKKQRLVKGLLANDPDERTKAEDAGVVLFEQSSFSSKNGGKYATFQEFLNALHSNLKIEMPTSFPKEHAVDLGAMTVPSAAFIHGFHKSKAAPSGKYKLPRILGGAAGVAAFVLAAGATIAMLMRDRESGPGDDVPQPSLVKPADPLKKDDGGVAEKKNEVTTPKVLPEKILPKKTGIVHSTIDIKGRSLSFAIGENGESVEFPRSKGLHFDRQVGKTREPAGSAMMFDREFLAKMEGIKPEEVPDSMTKDVLGQPKELIVFNYLPSGRPDRPGLYMTDMALVLPDLRKKEDRGPDDPDTVAFAKDEFRDMRIVRACSSKDKDGAENGIFPFDDRRSHPVYQAFFAQCPKENISIVQGGNTSGSRRAPMWMQKAFLGNLDTFKHK